MKNFDGRLNYAVKDELFYASRDMPHCGEDEFKKNCFVKI